LGRLLALLPNSRLVWKGLPGSNTLTYYENLLITDVKSFMTLTPGANVIKPSMVVIYEFSFKARMFVSGRPFQPSLMFVGKAWSLP
jgi:hypothetical protein